MVRRKSWVRTTRYFVKQDTGRMRCVFCRKMYQDNATHLQNHLLQKEGCSDIPREVRIQLVSKYGKTDKKTHKSRKEQESTRKTNSGQSETSESEEDSDSQEEEEELMFDRSRSRSPHSQNSEEGGSDSIFDRNRSTSSRNTSESGSATPVSSKCQSPGFSNSPEPGLRKNPILQMHQHNAALNEDITECLVQAIIATGCPFSLVESVHWIKLFKKMKPSYTMPTRYDLANRLLKLEFERVTEKVESLLTSARKLVLELDGWLNRRGEPIVNIVIDTPLPIFYDSLATHEMSHTAENMLVLADGVISKVGPEKFLGVVTDSASNMVKMKELLHTKYPHISVWPCVAHLLHNLIKDIYSGKKMNELLTDFKLVVNEVNGKLLKVVFRKIQLKIRPEHQPRALNSPAATRFGGHILLLESVSSTKDSLLELSRYRHEESKHIRLSDDSANALNRRGIWTLLETALKMSKPILQWLTRLEGDTSTIGEAVEAFYHIQQKIDTHLPQLNLDQREEQKILTKLDKRRKFGLTPIHFLANMLDPRFQGRALSKTEIQSGTKQLISICDLNPQHTINKDAILIAFANFRQCVGEFDDLKDVTRESPCNTLWPDVWWSTFHLTSELCELAIEVTMLTPSSSATERVNSCYDSVHTKKRNRLVTERAGMITFCKHNYKLLDAPKRKRPSAKSLPNLYDRTVVLAQDEIFEESDFNISDAEESEEEPELDTEIFEGHTAETVKSAEEALRYLFADE